MLKPTRLVHNKEIFTYFHLSETFCMNLQKFCRFKMLISIDA